MRTSFVVVLLALGLAACSEAPPAALGPGVAAQQDSVLAVLRALDTEVLDAAYARLDDPGFASVPYLFSTETQQLQPNGEAVAAHTRTYRVTARGPVLVEEDSSGTFAFGGFDAFSERRRTVPALATSPAALVLPDEPAYLDPRGREVFSFAFAGDTLLGDQSVRVLSVRARPDVGDGQMLRAARLYVDASGALVGLRLHRRQESMLFGETSTVTLFLQPTPDGWLPGRMTSAAHVKAPLAAARRFQLDERYTFPVDS